MKILHIYKNGKLHCILTEEQAVEAFELLRDCFTKDSWDIRQPRSWLDILTAIVLIASSLYIGGHLIWFFIIKQKGG